jgi:hypothetical protein
VHVQDNLLYHLNTLSELLYENARREQVVVPLVQLHLKCC